MKNTTLKQQIEESPQILKQFLNYISAIQEKSTNTVQAYYCDLRQFYIYILKCRDIITDEQAEDTIKSLKCLTVDIVKSVTRDDILEYMYYCKNELHNNSNTRSRRLSAIKKYYHYLHSHKGIIDSDPAYDIDSPKKKKSLPKYLTLEEALKLLQSVDTDFTTRDYCILTLFLNCGLRLSELVNINLKDIREDNTIRIVGKGNKERTIYLNDACLSSLSEYMDERENIENIVDKDALFISKRRRTRLTTRRVEQIVDSCIKAAGLDGMGFSAHKLRHTAATLMYQNGTDVRTLQSLLGHNSLETTQIYTHIANKQIKNAVDNNPLSKVES